MAGREELDCRKASLFLSLAGERPLSAAEAESLRQHLERCLACRNFESQLHFLREASRRFRK